MRKPHGIRPALGASLAREGRKGGRHPTKSPDTERTSGVRGARIPPSASRALRPKRYMAGKFCQTMNRFPSESLKNADAPNDSKAIGPSTRVSGPIRSARWKRTPFF